MNIPKISSIPFKGFLTIQDSNNWYRFDTDNIHDIIDRSDSKETRIYSTEDSYRDKYKYLSIPYDVIPPDKIINAYTAACQNSKINVRLTNRNGQCETVK